MKKQILYIITLLCSAANTLHIQGMDCVASSSLTTTSLTSTAIKHFTPPLTLQQYRALTDQERYKLREELDQSPQLQSHPLLYEHDFWLFNQIAKQLNEEYPNAIIYGLGQTPSYLIAAMQALSTNPERYFCIPFSRNFCDVSARSVTSGGGKLCFTQTWAMKKDANPNLTLYQPVFTRLGLRLTDIIERYQKSQQKTVIIEFSVSCSGIASFLTALYAQQTSDDQAKLLQEALEVILLTDPRSKMGDERKIVVPGMKDPFTLTIKLSSNVFTLLSDCDKYNDRLMPKFSYNIWGTIDPFAFVPSRNAYLLLTHIYRFLKD